MRCANIVLSKAVAQYKIKRNKMVKQNGARSSEDTCHKKLIVRHNFKHDVDRSTATAQSLAKIAEGSMGVMPSSEPLDGLPASQGQFRPQGSWTKGPAEPGWGMFVNRATFTEMHLA